MNFLKRVKERIDARSSSSSSSQGTPEDLVRAEAGLESSRKHYREVVRTARALSKALSAVSDAREAFGAALEAHAGAIGNDVVSEAVSRSGDAQRQEAQLTRDEAVGTERVVSGPMGLLIDGSVKEARKSVQAREKALSQAQAAEAASESGDYGVASPSAAEELGRAQYAERKALAELEADMLRQMQGIAAWLASEQANRAGTLARVVEASKPYMGRDAQVKVAEIPPPEPVYLGVGRASGTGSDLRSSVSSDANGGGGGGAQSTRSSTSAGDGSPSVIGPATLAQPPALPTAARPSISRRGTVGAGHALAPTPGIGGNGNGNNAAGGGANGVSGGAPPVPQRRGTYAPSPRGSDADGPAAANAHTGKPASSPGSPGVRFREQVETRVFVPEREPPPPLPAGPRPSVSLGSSPLVRATHAAEVGAPPSIVTGSERGPQQGAEQQQQEGQGQSHSQEKHQGGSSSPGSNAVDPVLDALVSHLEARLSTRGLLRIPGDGSVVPVILSRVRSGEPLTDRDDAHDVASALKTHLRGGEPLVPPSARSKAMADGGDDPVSQLRHLAAELPEVKAASVARLLRFLGEMARRSDENAMTVENILTCFGPNGPRSGVSKEWIEHADEAFGAAE